DDAEKYLTRACDVFRAYMDARMESGQDEGFSYTSYSTNEMTKALEALARVTGDTELSRHPFLTEMLPRWLLYSAAPPAGFTAFSDALSKGYFGTTLHYLNRVLRNGHAGWLLRECDHSASWPLRDRIFWYDPKSPVTPPTKLPQSAVIEEAGTALLRSGWGKDDALFALRANNSTYSHNHFDQNSFQIAVGGTWIGRDPAYQDLGTTGPTKVFSQRVGHSTIQVDGDGQDQLGGGRLEEWFLSPFVDYVKGSAAGSYIAPRVHRFDRRVLRLGHNRFAMVDDLAAAGEHEFTWAMFHGPLFDHAVDGTPVEPETWVRGDTFYGSNGTAGVWGFAAGDGDREIRFASHRGAEKYGLQTQVRPTRRSASERLLTMLEVAALHDDGDDAFHFRADALMSRLKEAGGAEHGLPRRVENAGVVYLEHSGGSKGFCEFEIEVDATDTYVVETMFMAHGGLSATRLSVDGRDLGGTYDPEFFALTPAPVFSHGAVRLARGKHRLRYRKASTGRTDDKLAIVSVRVAPVDSVPAVRDNGLRYRYLHGAGAMGVGTSVDAGVRSRTVHGQTDWRTELLAFRAGRARRSYTLGELESDGTCAVAQFGAGEGVGRPLRYAAVDASRLRAAGIPLLAASAPIDVSVDSGGGPIPTTATVRTTARETEVSLWTPNEAGSVSTGDGTLAFLYDSRDSSVTVRLPRGEHRLIVRI
ncbi:MAG TPA: heparinase II/III family protein, partial [Actinopolymorphaceae bacterium]